MSVRPILRNSIVNLGQIAAAPGGVRGYIERSTGRPVAENPRIVGIAHGGGPANTFNAVAEAFVGKLFKNGCYVFGFEDGCEGLLDNGRGVLLTPENTAGIRNFGDLIIGTARKNPNAAERAYIKTLMQSTGMVAQVFAGGDDTASTTGRCSDDGLNVLSLGKTVDDDLPWITLCYGHLTAIARVSDLLKTYLRDSRAMNSNYFVEVMGRRSGNLAMRSCLKLFQDSQAWEREGVARSFIGEEFTQQGLSQLVSAMQGGNLMAARVLSDLAQAVTIRGKKEGLQWITSNISGVDPADVNVCLEGLRDLMTSIAAERKEEGLKYNVFVGAEGIAERIRSSVTNTDAEGRPLEWTVDLFGQKKTLAPDEHNNPKVGEVKVGRYLAEALHGQIGKRFIFEPLTYQARCVDPVPEDIELSMALGTHAADLVLAGDFGRIVGHRHGRADSTLISELPRDPKTGKITPRCTDLSSEEYYAAKAREWWPQGS